jgi:hypothetical protein
VLALVGLVLAFCLVVVGVALTSPPAALVVAGVLIGAAALLTDFDRKDERR